MDIDKLIAKAFEAQINSYSPYSHCKVGAALLCESGNIYCGCNIENASYICGGCARSEETLYEHHDAVYVFNRLVDVNEIDYIDINGHIYKRK